ncbi:MAG: pyridoxal 5'-phosphate synthase glutaminase subunit PdxT [Dehalococcoidales bacterium]|nr:pyridoxal 5'-phosphate synthase glutaminase subunit PdxT [Dehalococcoidales bacterium]
MKIGILALQGAFLEHISAIHKLGMEAIEIRKAEELKGLDGLIIPGGESTTILKLMHGFELFQPLKQAISSGMLVMGTCAGMICLAMRVFNSQESKLEPLQVMDIEVKRNAFGRQVDSFEIDLPVAGLDGNPFHAVFIRSPLIQKAGPQVDVLARLPDGVIVAARQANMIVTSFHPELTGDLRLHQYFIRMADKAAG